jgi:Glycosyltransferase family 87
MKGRRLTPRHIALIVGMIALWAACLGLAWLLGFQSRFGMIDFGAYYEGAQRLTTGQALYQGFVGNTYIYPPLLAQLLVPLTLLSRETAAQVWFWLNVAVLIGVTAALDRVSQRRGFCWLVVPIFAVLLDALQIGQVTIILLALLTGAWLAVRADRRFLCGLLLALATWIKVYPAFLILYFAWKREWQVVRAALIVGLALALLQIALSGVDTFAAALTTLTSLTNYGELRLYPKNASINGFATQLFGSLSLVQPLVVSPLLALLTRVLLTLALVGATVGLTLGRLDLRRFDLEFALVLLTSLLLSPTLYTTGMPPLLLVLVLLLRSRPTKAMRWFVVGVCVILSLYWLFTTGYSGDPPLSGLLLAYGFYTLIAVWGVIAWRLQRQPAIAAPLVEAYSAK